MIPVLVSKSFLRPLGRGVAQNAPKRFSSVTIMELAADPKQMDRMQQILTAHHRSRNRTGLPRVGSVIHDPKEAGEYGFADKN